LRLIALTFALCALAVASSENLQSPGGMRLLPGYSARRSVEIDAAAWTIEGKSGLQICLEAGPNQGLWADPREAAKYSWHREQEIQGHKAYFALVRPGLKTQWDRDDTSGLPPGNILLVTFPLEGASPDFTANFSAKLAGPEDLADALLMITTFDPSKGPF